MDFGAGAGNGGMARQQRAAPDVMSWYMEIPLISRLYLTGAFLTTAACAVDIVSPFSLYFNWDLVISQGQIWRLVTRLVTGSSIVFFARNSNLILSIVDGW